MNLLSKKFYIKLASVLFVLAIIFSASVVVFAQDATEYELLEPLPFVSSSDGRTTVNKYIPGIIQLIIALAGALAVIKIVFGGIQYMSSDAITGKENGKKHIWDAIWGLVLIISAWLILYTVNPNLVNFNFTIEGLEVGDELDGGLGGGIGTEDPTGYGKAWGEDSIIRSALDSMGIDINKPNCVRIGQPSCTSVYELNSLIIRKLQDLIDICELRQGEGNCGMTLTGGTEYWLHGNRSYDIDSAGTQHVPRGRAIDVSIVRTDGFTSFLRNFCGAGSSICGPSAQTGCAPGSERYDIDGVLFVNEGSVSNENDDYDGKVRPTNPHWHVCF